MYLDVFGCILIGLDLFGCINPASRGVAAHTAGFFWSVTGAKGGVEHEDRVCWHASQSL